MIILHNAICYYDDNGDDDGDDDDDGYDIHDNGGGGDIYDGNNLVKASICPIPLKLCLGKTMPGFNIMTITMMLMIAIK